MTTTNVDRLVEEIVDIFIARDSHPQVLSAYRARVSKVLTTLVAEAEAREWKRCVDLLDKDHTKCPLRLTCVGYQNAQSDLLNNPPALTNTHGE